VSLDLGLLLIVSLLPIVALLMIKSARAERRCVETAPAPDSPPPVTPDPDYICANCGMLVQTGHGHTRIECGKYLADSSKPDHRAIEVLLSSRNRPKVSLPYYYEGKFQNWDREAQ